jgi:hypothetical protein
MGSPVAADRTVPLTVPGSEKRRKFTVDEPGGTTAVSISAVWYPG